ncbi:GTP cyclohydrolase II [Nanoarchaeota archaeon]
MNINRSAEALLPTEFGIFKVIVYSSGDNLEHAAIINGDLLKKPILVRLHSECLTGDVFHSKRCDCHDQLINSIKKISQEGGVVIYLRQEGRGIGLLNKIKAYSLQDNGLDTVDANIHLGFKADERDYEIAALILKDLKINEIKLLTNNPDKINDLENHGIIVKERIKLILEPNDTNKKYLETKKNKLGHLI